MADLTIDYDRTRSVGQQVTSKGGEFMTLLSKIKSLNSDLQSFWQGSDAMKYTGAVTEQAEYMTRLGDTVNEIGGFLVKVGNAYEQAMEANSSSING